MNCPLCSAPERKPYCSTTDGSEYWECPHCALIWLEETQRLGRIEEKNRYLSHENHGARYFNYLAKTAEPVLAQVANGAVGLDYGCGPTEGMKELISPMGFSVDSYDPFFFPRQLLKNHYDFVLCNEAAEHFFDPLVEFGRIDSTMKKGAVLGVSSQIAPWAQEFERWYYRRDPTHVVFYREGSVRWLAAHFGWELLRLESPLWVFRKA